jgi:uncharacterized protein (DUF58 family)
MHESIFPSTAPAPAPDLPGVYITLPELVKLQHKAKGYSFLPRQPVGSILSGRHASRLRGRGLNFEEIRRYLPGDDIRNMDWHVTARMRAPHVRAYTEERDRPVLLLIDQRQHMFFGTRRVLKSVAAAEAAALAAWRALAQGDRVGAIIFNDEEIKQFKPERSRAHVARILESVTRFNRELKAAGGNENNPAMYNRALDLAARTATHDYLTISISDGYGFDEKTSKSGTRLAAHNDVMVLFIYDPLEASLPAGGQLRFGDDRLQLEVDTNATGIRQKFSASFQQRFDAIEQLCRQRGVPRIAISTELDVADQVRARLGYIPRGI